MNSALKFSFSIFLIVLGHLSFSQGFTGDSWAQAQQAKKANISVTYAETPKFAEMINGQPSGICFDIMNDFKDFVKTNYNIELNMEYKKIEDPKSFDLFLNVMKLSKGGVFGLGDVTVTERRKQIYNFSPPYFANVAILVTSKSSPTLTSIDKITQDYSSMTAVVQKGSTHDKRIQKIISKYGDLKVEYVSNSEQKLEKVLSSPSYYTYVDLPNYLDIINKKMDLKRQIAGDEYGEDFAFVMPKNSDWSPVVAEFFNAEGGYIKGSQYRKVLSDNLGITVLKLLDSLEGK